MLAFYKRREVDGWKRYASPSAARERRWPHWAERMAKQGVTNLAQYYTSEYKYSKERFERISDEVVGPDLLRSGVHMPRETKDVKSKL